MTNVDKRSVATDALETLGTIIDDTAGRDAIHLAVEPVTAAEKLFPGQDVGLSYHGASSLAVPHVGIVDPFLKSPVMMGEVFWLVVYPRQITSLRHVWTHPAFDSEEPTKPSKEVSEQWLRDFCDTADCPGYEKVIAQAVEQEDCWDDEYLHFNGYDASGSIPPEFWTHVEIVTGKTITNRPSYFSCGC